MAIAIQQLLLLQQVIDYIDEHIKEDIHPEELANLVGYSPYHFYRIFDKHIGYTVMNYVQKRKLQFALYELVRGKKIIQIALDYGFETHSGFTKAFKKCFGSPPSLYRLHCPISLPQKLDLISLRQKQTGGIVMQPKIMYKDAFDIAGKTFESHLERVSYTRDAPAFWEQRIPADEAIERTLYNLLSPKEHGEYCINISGTELKDKFTYLFAINYDQDVNLPKELTKLKIPAATYAVFRTPLVAVEHFVSSIKGTWQYILDDWLPSSHYEVDESVYDFEYYDEHCHDWIYEKIFMEIYLPIKRREID
ncbi:AraC family transcriptional regulator [Psychrobacillus lasiicapitis]|uniref:AraC family transcriptional regulator n=1 Tax=Psychrobacillus lasiicapitis TaxID=1636719 RepID=UPI0019A091FA|nr:AraC family transcriptional regulator [Psychrobacillus lasiicapitis]GGA45070.1 AraC family transcriptional regulator [Psychrobacillus lasiicapitis]